MAKALDCIMLAVGAEGIAVIRSVPGSAAAEAHVLHQAGTTGVTTLTANLLLSRAQIGTPALSLEPNGRPIVAAVCRGNGGQKIGLVLWRRRGARAWAAGDVGLVDSAAGILWLLLDRDVAQHDADAIPIDPLTALLSQRTFVAEANRHIARLDRDNVPGTLILAEVDNLESVNRLLGPDGGDQVLRRAAMLLRSVVRPTDLVGRVGDAEFAVWLSGADHMTAAERAEDLCLEAPGKMIVPANETAPEVTFSIGIATRQAGENYGDLARRASQAMRQVQREGGGYWRVSLGSAV